MKNVHVASRWAALTLAGTAMTIGIAALGQSEAYARRPPEPECGPTRQWECVRPGCEDCPVILFEGTVCEKAAFEKKTGRVCS